MMRRIRKTEIDCSSTALDLARADLYFEEIRLHHPDDAVRGSYVMPLVTLRTKACSWSSVSGCTMCGYHLGSAKQQVVGVDDLLTQTRWVIRRLDPNIYHTLVFTSNGSFLDPDEVPDTVRPELMKMLYEAGFRFVVMESRPGFITPARLDALITTVPYGMRKTGKIPFSISFGIESASDFILTTCINKGVCVSELADGAAIIQERSITIDGYVLLGKPFLTAQEDCDDALRTIRWASELGANYLFVMVTNRVAGSLANHLIARRHHSLPSLWRAVRLLEMLPASLRRLVQIKGISHAPYPPIEYATTCQGCHDRIVRGLNFWNQTGDFAHIQELPFCACRERFETDEWANRPDLSLPCRIHKHYLRLASDLDLNPSIVPPLTMLDMMWQKGQP
ncbi:MAG: hypothetical protein HQL77_15385 [Magnetococcales bacterium]|nr:hypothetical protein [Magnetococcales bacterium]